MKPSKKDHIPLKLPQLSINEENIKRVYSTKFLGVILDENVNWNKHIKIIENKTSKNLGIMYKSKHLLNRNCLKNIYFSFIHSYLNYCNIAWASTYKSNLKKLYTTQKKASRIIMDKNMFTEARPLMKDLNILNVYQLNIFQTLPFMFKQQSENNPQVFKSQFSKISHRYPTRYSLNNYAIPKTMLRKTDFAITCRAPSLWNKIATAEMKKSASINIFKSQLKSHLLNSQTETSYF